MHWCWQETEALFALLSVFPLVGYYIKNLHAKWHCKHKTICNNKDHLI